MSSIAIQDGDPPRPGSYVVFTNDDLFLRYAKRVLLMWSEGRWWYPLSDQKFRGHVYGWIGPLPAMELVEDTDAGRAALSAPSTEKGRG